MAQISKHVKNIFLISISSFITLVVHGLFIVFDFFVKDIYGFSIITLISILRTIFRNKSYQVMIWIKEQYATHSNLVRLKTQDKKYYNFNTNYYAQQSIILVV